MTAPGPSAPDHALVYGNDHSPWVQAVLLGLHERGVPATLLMLPPRKVFLRSGVLMPAARLGDGEWQLDSARILAGLGFEPPDAETAAELQRVFGLSALRRTDEPFGFWRRFSWVRDESASWLRRCWNQLRRPFSMFYFFALITLGRSQLGGWQPERFLDALSTFERRLEGGGPFFGGDAPGTVDLQLFGLIQMCASMPGAPLEVVRSAPGLDALRAWISTMQARFEGYTHFYTATVFEPGQPEVVKSTPAERVAYWTGTILVWLAWPLSLAATVWFVWRVRAKGLQRA